MWFQEGPKHFLNQQQQLAISISTIMYHKTNHVFYFVCMCLCHMVNFILIKVLSNLITKRLPYIRQMALWLKRKVYIIFSSSKNLKSFNPSRPMIEMEIKCSSQVPLSFSRGPASGQDTILPQVIMILSAIGINSTDA